MKIIDPGKKKQRVVHKKFRPVGEKQASRVALTSYFDQGAKRAPCLRLVHWDCTFSRHV